MFENWYSPIIVSAGALIGANTRVKLLSILLRKYKNNNYIGLLLLNLCATFLLGLFLSISAQEEVQGYLTYIKLFFTVGFLGSLSTFSTFIFDLLNLVKKRRWKKVLLSITLNVFGGIFVISLGSKLVA